MKNIRKRLQRENRIRAIPHYEPLAEGSIKLFPRYLLTYEPMFSPNPPCPIPKFYFSCKSGIQIHICMIVSRIAEVKERLSIRQPGELALHLSHGRFSLTHG